MWIVCLIRVVVYNLKLVVHRDVSTYARGRGPGYKGYSRNQLITLSVRQLAIPNHDVHVSINFASIGIVLRRSRRWGSSTPRSTLDIRWLRVHRSAKTRTTEQNIHNNSTRKQEKKEKKYILERTHRLRRCDETIQPDQDHRPDQLIP